MKSLGARRGGDLVGDNLAKTRDSKWKAQTTVNAEILVAFVADVLDEIAAGHDTYITIGANRQRDSFLVTVNRDGAKMQFGGVDLTSLLTELSALLD